MKHRSQLFSGVVGRLVTLALGGFYVTAAILWPFAPTIVARTGNEMFTISTLIAVPGTILIYGGYRLPRADIRPDLFSTITKWCFAGIGVMLGVLLFIALATGLSNPVVNGLVLTALFCIAGFGIGYQDARAKSRALNAEERRREAERYSRELERYETIVETVDDGIYVADEDNCFTLVNEAYAE
ncbi:PAS domain-containing protein [Haladaptatus sp. DFWS20]|uniref:PAS domain-containing protein n=1 Tax=Haladaptatus sp. DFWS20 TaxID=3403467 RepID=UPI003EB73E30